MLLMSLVKQLQGMSDTTPIIIESDTFAKQKMPILALSLSMNDYHIEKSLNFNFLYRRKLQNGLTNTTNHHSCLIQPHAKIRAM